MKIIGIAGKKQSGKNTTANILHGTVLKKQGLIKDFNINGDGKLIIYTEDSHGRAGWGEFDVTRKDGDFIEYSEHNMWPYIKLYSFADNLKQICVELFNIPQECVWGTDEQKNQTQEHLLWENMPRFQNMTLMKKMPLDARKGWDWREGPMTAREFMQFFGTDIMRKVYGPIWINSTIKKIQREQSELAIIADVRFPNEADVIKDVNGVVVRLTRHKLEDNHSSEIALDDYAFTDYIDNQDDSVDALMVQVKSFYQNL
jgi:hypothetical protein